MVWLGIVLSFAVSAVAAYPAVNGSLVSYDVTTGLMQGWAYEPGVAVSVVEARVNGSYVGSVGANVSCSWIVPTHAPDAQHCWEYHAPLGAWNARIDVSVGSMALYNTPAWSQSSVWGLGPFQGVQGVDDQTMSGYLLAHGEDSALAARYSTLEAELRPGVRRYNMFWSALEPSPSSASPLPSCPPGTHAMPRDDEERKAAGFHRFHCYADQFFASLGALLERDRAIGAVSGGILYGSPSWCRNTNCTGFPWGNGTYKYGCVPREGACRDDFEDYVNALAWTWNGNTSTKGHLQLGVVWNEVGSCGWMDTSPITPSRYPSSANLSAATVAYRASVVADLTARTYRAFARHSTDFLTLISTDHFMTPPPHKAGEVCSTGNMPILDHIWPTLGLNFSWALAVHPYDDGNPTHDLSKQGIYTFATLDSYVRSYQRAWLRSFGIPPQGMRAQPQTWLYASEQGWAYRKASMNDTLRSRNICFAHNLSVAQDVFAVTHNFFQASQPNQVQNGAFFNLLPQNLLGNLTNATGYCTWEAYKATSPIRWNNDSQHYCCTHWNLGCNHTAKKQNLLTPSTRCG